MPKNSVSRSPKVLQEASKITLAFWLLRKSKVKCDSTVWILNYHEKGEKIGYFLQIAIKYFFVDTKNIFVTQLPMKSIRHNFY